MRTGIKTFFRKILWITKHPDKIIFSDQKILFPEEGISQWKINLKLYSLVNELREINTKKFYGALNCKPDPLSLKVWYKLLKFNPNNLGNWSIIKQSKDLFGTRIYEREAIWKLIDLYKGNRNKMEGYITSGATESNIYMAWIGRKYLESKIKKKRICQIITDLSHYSIIKSSDIIGVSNFIVSLNPNNWGIDTISLKKKILELYKKGYRAFIIPLTIGHTLTGTHDPINDICLLIRELKKKYKSLNFFIWIDAALNGLIEPFTNNNFKPFNDPEIKGLVTDFHKYGFVPFPSGIVIYRKYLRKYIEKPIPYLKEKDNTLTGSRSGIAAVACWAMIQKLGKSGYRDLIKKCQKKKNNFIKEITELDKNIKVVTHPNSLSGGIIINKNVSQKSILYLEKKYYMRPTNIILKFLNKKRNCIIYNFFILNK